MPTYTKSLSGDFGGTISLSQFHSEIEEDTNITTLLDGVELDGDDVKIKFDDDLSGPETTALNTLVTNHSVLTSNSNLSSNTYDYLESTAETSTTSITYVQKASLQTKYYPVPTVCKIEWYYRVASDNHDKYMRFRVELDDTTTIHDEYRELGLNDTFQRQITSGFYVTTLGIGQHTVDFDFLTTDDGKTVTVSDVRLFVTDL